MICLVCTLSLSAQEKATKKVVVKKEAPTGAAAEAKEKKEIRKEVEVDMIDGEKVLTIKTTENGKKTVEKYKGAEAEKKMKEMEEEAERLEKEAAGDPNKKVVIEKKTVEKEKVRKGNGG